MVCASTPFARLRGLLGKLRLNPGEGLWTVPSRGIHTIGMLFPIDAIYLDEELRVTHLIEHLRPFRLASLRLNCTSVLEVPLHTIYTSQTQVGDQLAIYSHEEAAEYVEKANPVAVKALTGGGYK